MTVINLSSIWQTMQRF